MRFLGCPLTPVAIFVAQFLPSLAPQAHADIPWPEVVQRLAYENDKLARRPQGHNSEYFVVCTLYYTPKESGFTFERGFDGTPVTKPGLGGRKYPRALLLTRQVEAVFWLIAIPQRSNQVRAACVMEPSWRHLRQRCKRSLAALVG